MSWLVVLPLLLPFLTAILLMALGGAAQKWASAVGAAVQLAAALFLLRSVSNNGILVSQGGGWPAPFGISLVVDHFSAIMVAVSGVMSLAVAVYAAVDINESRGRLGFHPLFHLQIAGINGAFTAGDIFNLYVWFEVLLAASFALLTLGSEARQLKGAPVYFALNLIASALLLTAVALLYGLTGTLNMAELAIWLPQQPAGVVTSVAMLLLLAFGLKAAFFPLYFWLPAAYPTPPIAVSAIFSGLLTKVGVYALIRLYTLMPEWTIAYAQGVLIVVAGLTMLSGVLGAVAQNEMRRLLSFHIISQVGYPLMGLAFFTPLALAGTIFFLVHVIIAKAALFLLAGVVQKLCRTLELDDAGGLYGSYPMVSLLFLIPALSLAGIPPFSGFWAKLVLVEAGLEVGQYAIVAVSLLVSLLTLFSMAKIWMKAFWKPLPPGKELVPNPTSGRLLRYLPMGTLALVLLAMGLLAQPFLAVSQRAAEELLQPAHYIESVLGEGE